MKSGVDINGPGMQAVLKRLDDLKKRAVYVGIPGDSAQRDGPINNAQLGYLMEYGSPANNIPARPFLHPGVKLGQKSIAKFLQQAAKGALLGDAAMVDKGLTAAGLIAESSVKNYMDTGPFQPLAEATLAARARRGRTGAAAELASRAEGNAPDNSNARPLIDTGELRNHITHVVK